MAGGGGGGEGGVEIAGAEAERRLAGTSRDAGGSGLPAGRTQMYCSLSHTVYNPARRGLTDIFT